MRVVALEEHFTVPALAAKYVKPDAIARRGHFKGRNVAPGKASPLELLPEIGEQRFKSLDDAGITVQVLSNSGARPRSRPRCGRDCAGARASTTIWRRSSSNIPSASPALPRCRWPAPDACAGELMRAVKDLKMVGAMIHGTTEGRFLDHPSYDGLSAAAVQLDVPIYIHPNVPTPGRAAGLLLDLPEGTDRVLATAAWGWHSEVAIHVLRMVFAGTFDKHPKLQDDHRPHGRDAAGDARADRRGFRGRHRAPEAPAQRDHRRAGLDHHQRRLHPAAVHRRAADVRHRPHHVLGRLPVRAPMRGAAIFSTRSRWRQPTWRSSATATRMRC